MSNKRIKVTFKNTISKDLKKIRKEFNRDAAPYMADVIADQIVQGLSPVRGKNRFKEYSDGYAKKKGRKAPVDMLNTGRMLNSLKVKLKQNKINIYFDSVIAYYHDKAGAGRGKVIRRLLPTRRGEKFKVKITKGLNRILKNAVKKYL